jgi:hypothetical protein
MAEDHTPASLQDYRLGHAPRGIQGVYEHLTRAMITRLMCDLEQRWRNGLVEAGLGCEDNVPSCEQLVLNTRSGKTASAPSG